MRKNLYNPLVKCSYPDCNHVDNLITNYHCTTVHNISKKELIKEYGDPIPLEVNAKLRNQNVKMTTNITEHSFWAGGIKKR